MSVENHPNINAAGLVSDIITAINLRIRGNANKVGMNRVLGIIGDKIPDFASEISEELDAAFGIDSTGK